jgi:hypothetical protein
MRNRDVRGSGRGGRGRTDRDGWSFSLASQERDCSRNHEVGYAAGLSSQFAGGRCGEVEDLPGRWSLTEGRRDTPQTVSRRTEMIGASAICSRRNSCIHSG